MHLNRMVSSDVRLQVGHWWSIGIRLCCFRYRSSSVSKLVSFHLWYILRTVAAYVCLAHIPSPIMQLSFPAGGVKLSLDSSQDI